MLEGIIIKGVGGFYYVKVANNIFECRARGLFRKDKITPLVGDNVRIRADIGANTGYIEEVLERKNELIRPPVSNINQVIIVFSVKMPDPNLWLLDRFILLAEYNKLEVVICINKIELAYEEANLINDIYKNTGYKILHTSGKTEQGIKFLREELANKLTVFAGPSGVGKSTLLNKVQPNLQLKTGDISEKTGRGKHTTRHTELLELEDGGWVVDTPGFSSLDIDFIDLERLEEYFVEINKYSHMCKFSSCKHFKEPGCSVKDAVAQGKISKSRYENYINFYEELSDSRRY